RPQRDIRFGRSGSSDGSGRRRSVAAEFDFARKDPRRGPGIHKQENKIGGLAAQLQTGTGAFKGHHRRRTPFALEVFSAAARHDTSPIATTDANRKLLDRWQHDPAVSLV